MDEDEEVRVQVLQIAPPWFEVPPLRYGGTEVVVAGLTDGLVAAGHDVTLLASGGSRTAGCLRTVYDEPPSGQLGDLLVELPHVLAGYRDRWRHDLVHDHTPVGVAVGAMLDGPPIVHTVHGAWTPTLCRLYREVSKDVHLVAISHDHAARAPADLTLAGVVPNGIDLSRYPLSEEPSRDLGWVGRAGPDKGADIAVEVAHRLGRRLRMAVKINEPAEREWWDRVMVPHLDEVEVDVVRNATHAQKLEVLQGSQVLLFPIRWDEPFGLVMAEANACGTPVVAFRRGSAPEVLADGVTGVLVEPGDVDALTAAVDAAGRLDRRACRAHVAHSFSIERMVAGYLQLYERLTR